MNTYTKATNPAAGVSDEEVRAWAERHGFDGRSVSELRAAFEDAESFAATAPISLRSEWRVTREDLRDVAHKAWMKAFDAPDEDIRLHRYVADAIYTHIADLLGIEETK